MTDTDDFSPSFDEASVAALIPHGFDLMSTDPLSTDEARRLTETIRNASEVLWVLISKAHDGKAWSALGYATWEAYVNAEFDMSRSRSYQILDQARVIAAIEATVPDGTQVRITEAAARDLKGVLDDVLPRIQHETQGLEPARASEVLEGIVDESRQQARDQREAAYSAADDDDMDDDYEPVAQAPAQPAPATLAPARAPAPVYDDIDEIDVARIRRNVNAAHDIYSSLSALAGLPDDLEEILEIIPEERHAQIASNLGKAKAALARFDELWQGFPRAGDPDED